MCIYAYAYARFGARTRNTHSKQRSHPNNASTARAHAVAFGPPPRRANAVRAPCAAKRPLKPPRPPAWRLATDKPRGGRIEPAMPPGIAYIVYVASSAAGTPWPRPAYMQKCTRPRACDAADSVVDLGTCSTSPSNPSNPTLHPIRVPLRSIPPALCTFCNGGFYAPRARLDLAQAAAPRLARVRPRASPSPPCSPAPRRGARAFRHFVPTLLAPPHRRRRRRAPGAVVSSPRQSPQGWAGKCTSTETCYRRTGCGGGRQAGGGASKKPFP